MALIVKFRDVLPNSPIILSLGRYLLPVQGFFVFDLLARLIIYHHYSLLIPYQPPHTPLSQSHSICHQIHNCLTISAYIQTDLSVWQSGLPSLYSVKQFFFCFFEIMRFINFRQIKITSLFRLLEFYHSLISLS